MKYLLLCITILFSLHLSAQNSTINGRIKNNNDTAIKIVFIRDGQRFDSVTSTYSGHFCKVMPAGTSDLELSKEGMKPARLEQVSLNPGHQSVNITLKFTTFETSTEVKEILPQGDTVQHISYFYIHPRVPKGPPRILTPALMRRGSDDDELTRPRCIIQTVKAESVVDSAASTKVKSAETPANASEPAIAESRTIMTAEILASDHWYMTFSPNPVSGPVNIFFSEHVETITITDLFGKVLFKKVNNGSTSLQVDMASWNSGVYIISAVCKNESLSGKLVIKH
jgi:acylphosphatase